MQTILKNKLEIESKYGPWTAHNIRLSEDVYTISKSENIYDKVDRVVQNVVDVSQKPIENMRVLDLGCLEGLYSIFFAMKGADVVGVDIREANIKKANFSKEVLDLKNVEFVLDDVRNIDIKKYGEFDLVLGIGILYHLDSSSLFTLLKNISEMSKYFYIDTHFSLHPRIKIENNNNEYFGTSFKEHSEKDQNEIKESRLWASLGNDESFWLTKPSLINALGELGFTSVFECYLPYAENQTDRSSFLAIKNNYMVYDNHKVNHKIIPEKNIENISPNQKYISFLKSKIKNYFKK